MLISPLFESLFCGSECINYNSTAMHLITTLFLGKLGPCNCKSMLFYNFWYQCTILNFNNVFNGCIECLLFLILLESKRSNYALKVQCKKVVICNRFYFKNLTKCLKLRLKYDLMVIKKNVLDNSQLLLLIR